MKKSLFRIILAVLCVINIVSLIPVSAFSGYSTYTYSIDGYSVDSPDAYTPDVSLNSKAMGIETPIDTPTDLFVAPNNYVYIADPVNNRIVVLDSAPWFKFEIDEFVNNNGVEDSLLEPNGVFVNEEKIYVADTGNKRIVVFDLEGNYLTTYEEPSSDIIEEGEIYRPISLVVDNSGRMYVVSSTTYNGIIVLNSDGVFQSYIGAQKVTYNVLDIFWRNFLTAEQLAQQEQIVSTEFNNIAIDKDGFIYATISSIDENTQQTRILQKDKSGDYAPVKKLNSAGTDIMHRNGFYPPSGEVSVSWISFNGEVTGASKIIDVAVGPEGTWSIIDEKRSRVYTYDDDGKLLFIFGDKGSQLGNLKSIQAIAYQGDRILVMDKIDNNVTIYNRTEYGDIIIQALKNNNERNYNLAVADYQKILQRNNNFDAAYIGIGKAYYRQGEWDKAMEYFKYAYDTTNYSNAFSMWRQDWVSKYVLVIPLFVVVVCFLVSKFFGYAGKVNKKTMLSTSKSTYKQEILYGFHVIFHPFDGFWDLKHEKRGSVRAALTFMIIAIASFTYQAIGQSYMFNPRGGFSSVLIQTVSILVPVFLWVTANWCLTTLFDGEGSFKDIFIATGYALVPMPLFIIPCTLLTHVMTLSEGSFISMLLTVAWIWVGLLVFFGSMITHDYTLGKNVLTSLGTIVGMAFIMFVALLFSTLVGKIIGFITSIITEISYRF